MRGDRWERSLPLSAAHRPDRQHLGVPQAPRQALAGSHLRWSRWPVDRSLLPSSGSPPHRILQDTSWAPAATRSLPEPWGTLVRRMPRSWRSAGQRLDFVSPPSPCSLSLLPFLPAFTDHPCILREGVQKKSVPAHKIEALEGMGFERSKAIGRAASSFLPPKSLNLWPSCAAEDRRRCGPGS